MRKEILFLCTVCVSAALFAANDTNNTNPDAQKFIHKYINKSSRSYQVGSSIEQYKKIDSNVNLKQLGSISKSKKYDINITKSLNSKEAKNIASQINSNVQNQKFQTRISNYKAYILNNKQLDIKSKLGKYAYVVKDAEKKHFKDLPYQNKILGPDQRLIIAISSSIPNLTIKNYMSELHKVNTDVLFVLRGLVNNNPKYLAPTARYVSKLLKHGKKEYHFNVEVNPKIFTKYNIHRVPAIIFVKHYNPYEELSKPMQSIKKATAGEDIYIGYGDADIIYVLKRINKVAKSKHLAHLIHIITKGYFNVQ